jgi:hypothetical protein
MRPALAFVLASSLLAAAVPAAPPKEIVLPEGQGGIGFDDLRYAPALQSFLVGAGRTGMVHFLDAATLRIVTAVVDSPKPASAGGHGDGVTSADEGKGFVYAIDRTTKEVVGIDPSTRRVFTRTKLSASPDYVRWVAPTREIWVTEPDAEKIEVFRLRDAKPITVGSIAVPGGPESLVVDAARKRAYAHLWKGTTVAIDLASRSIVARWKNGCDGSRGIALDGPAGLLFTGCSEGKVTALDLAKGKLVGEAPTGAGVDIIDYDPARRHVYAPGGKAATLTIVAVRPGGKLAALGSMPAAEGAHCVATDGAGHVLVCAPKAGTLLAFEDPYPAEKR